MPAFDPLRTLDMSGTVCRLGVQFAEWGMVVKFVRAPNSPVLLAAGIALLLLAARNAEMAAAGHFPMALVVASCARNAILGAALLYVALRASRYAGVTAVIVATLLTFGAMTLLIGTVALLARL
jgi:hypothetical protein